MIISLLNNAYDFHCKFNNCDAFKYLDEEAAVTALRFYMMQENEKVDISGLLDIANKLKARKVLSTMRELVEASAKGYPRIDKDKFKAYINWNARKE